MRHDGLLVSENEGCHAVQVDVVAQRRPRVDAQDMTPKAGEEVRARVENGGIERG